MRLLRTQAGKWISWLGFSQDAATAVPPAPTSALANAQLDDYRSQIVQLRAHNQQLEQTVAEATATHRATMMDQRRIETALRERLEQLEQTVAEATATHRATMMDQRRIEAALRERLEQSRSAFEVAWSGFTAEPAIEDQLAHLDPGNDRARRWLLKS